jgi:hypothetical protein
MALGINEALQAIPLREPLDDASAMLQTRRARSLVTPTYSVPFGASVMM